MNPEASTVAPPLAEDAPPIGGVPAVEHVAAIRWEVIELCARLTHVIGVARSVGQIFGFVLSAPSPVTFDEVVEGLGISNGSASHGLRYLRRLGAVRVGFIAGDRRDYFEIETSLRKLVDGYIAEILTYQFGGLMERLQDLAVRVDDGPELGVKGLGARIGLLITWNKEARSAMDAALRALP